MQDILLISAIVIFCYMCAWFIWAQLIKNNGVVDIAWGLGFVLVTGVLGMTEEISLQNPRFILFLMIALWGIRLSAHIAYRAAGKSEDFRYQNFRKSWGRYPLLGAFFQVFMLQGLIMGILLLPVYLAYADTTALLFPTTWQWVGLAVFAVGFVFEAVGDYQLLRFSAKAENRGHIITHGLWKYTRHPNYFGESILWWGIGIYSLSFENGWFALVSPIVITYLLTRVSGIPMLERKYEKNPEFRAYAARTPAFFPKFR